MGDIRLLTALPYGDSLWEHEGTGDPLTAHQMIGGVESVVPGAVLAVGGRSWWTKPFLLGGI